jgi:hypothetical protein
MKTENKQSVIKDWVSELPFTQQALLMLSLRGADGMGKYNTAKEIVHYMRDVILHAAYPNYNGKPEGFMRGDYENWETIVKSFFIDVDAYPLHFYLHLIHAAEVVGYNHPDEEIAQCWLSFYLYACKRLHMNPETITGLNERLKM